MDDVKLKLVQSLDDLNDLKNWLGQEREWLGFDLETSGLNVGRDKIRTAQLGDERMGWTIPWDDYAGVVRELMNAYDRRMVAHNVLFDSKFLKREGIPLKGHLVHDSMVMAHLDNPMASIALKSLSKRLFGPMAVAGQQALDVAKKKQGWGWGDVPIDFPAYWAYGALDTVLTAKAASVLWPTIQDQRLIYDLELGAIMVMRDAELRGVRIDLDYVYSKRAELEMEMMEARPFIPEEIKNPGSPKQVRDYLLSRGAIMWKTTKGGELSVDDDVLKEQEAAGIPGVGALRKWRNAAWLVNNYFSTMQDLHVDGILRPSIKPVGARTGRMSIVQPALQTVPRGPIVRDAFIPRDGHVLGSTDYEQLELRVLAHCANETRMIEAIKRGEDLHDTAADDIFGPGQWDKEDRQIAKNANFAAAYVSGVATFARTAGIGQQRAQEIMDKYHSTYPGIGEFHRKIIREVQERGYVLTEFGRRIPVPERNEAYKGVNYAIQSTATADLLKLKIIELSNAGLGEYFRLPIHDEVFWEAPADIADEVKHEIETVMTETELFRCPLTAEGEVLNRWGDKYR